jgi:hypothetical protein
MRSMGTFEMACKQSYSRCVGTGTIVLVVVVVVVVVLVVVVVVVAMPGNSDMSISMTLRRTSVVRSSKLIV